MITLNLQGSSVKSHKVLIINCFIFATKTLSLSPLQKVKKVKNATKTFTPLDSNN